MYSRLDAREQWLFLGHGGRDGDLETRRLGGKWDVVGGVL
jgi:hypothetical protein